MHELILLKDDPILGSELETRATEKMVTSTPTPLLMAN